MPDDASTAVPPPATQPGPAAPYNPMEPMSPPPPRKKSPVALIGVFLAVVGAALGAIFVKFVLPLILVGAAGQVFDSAFGGPYMRLRRRRASFEQRSMRAVGDTFEGQTDANRHDDPVPGLKAGSPASTTAW